MRNQSGCLPQAGVSSTGARTVRAFTRRDRHFTRSAGFQAVVVVAGCLIAGGDEALAQQDLSNFMRSVFPGASTGDGTPEAMTEPAPDAAPAAQPAVNPRRPSRADGDASGESEANAGPVLASPPDPSALLSSRPAGTGPVTLYPDSLPGSDSPDSPAALQGASLDETVIRASLQRTIVPRPDDAATDPGSGDAAGLDEPPTQENAAGSEPKNKPKPTAKPKPAPKRQKDDKEFSAWDKELEKAVGDVAFVNDAGDEFEGRETDDGTFVGVIDYKDGGRYEGEAIKGKRQGRGTMTYPSGGRYTGEWQDDKWHGEGVGVAANGNRYEGTYRDGQKHGEGVYVWSDGDRYEGDFVDGLPEGEGVKLFANGDRYEGGWQSGLRHGQGEMVYANGDRYVGDWQRDKYHGTGTYHWAAGHDYEGSWEKGQRHGHGVFEFADGRVYEGEWRYDYRHGRGKETLANGESWDGNWYYDEPRGRPPRPGDQASTEGTGTR